MIDILLATYNGGKYIKELLDSLLAQDTTEWFCIISDDGSTDDTVEIITKYIAEYPGFFKLLEEDAVHSAKDNFMRLLSKSQSEYAMFCDQDDVWKQNKISFLLKAIKKMEVKTNAEPCLVFSDLVLVDRDLSIISNSFIEFSGYDASRVKLNQLVFENIIPGCSCIMNKKLVEYANKYETLENIRWHDWWVALVAAATGTITFVNEPLTLYRQHGDNVVGANNTRGFYAAIKRIRSLSISSYRSTHSIIEMQVQQLQELNNIPEIKDQWRALLKDMSFYNKSRKAKRIWYIFKNGISRKRRTIWTYLCV